MTWLKANIPDFDGLIANRGFGLSDISEAVSVSLPFYVREAQLVSLEVLNPSNGSLENFSFVWIPHANKTVVLTDESKNVFEINEIATLDVSLPSNAERYLRFFCSNIQAAAGVFLLMNGGEYKTPTGEKKEFPPIELTSLLPEFMSFRAHMVVGNEVSAVNMTVYLKTGKVEMKDDKLLGQIDYTDALKITNTGVRKLFPIPSTSGKKS